VDVVLSGDQQPFQGAPVAVSGTLDEMVDLVVAHGWLVQEDEP
jgi:hypothetical protein